MSETETIAPILHACTGCGAMLDVSGEQPLALVQCPTCGTAQRVRKQFGQYELQEVLGAGGMGAVYKAVDVNLNRPVAIKLLRREFSSNPEFLAKFENEAKITAAINHPHVVKVFSFGEDQGVFYIAMEIVDKGSLDDQMAKLKKVPEAQVLEVGIQVALGLQAGQRVGLIHRDVKPGNILFSDAHTAKIVDFGLALLAAEAAEAAGEVWGTPYYVAPEKLRHEPEDFRSDMYSLGGTLYHALAGEPPFEAETPSLVARKHLDAEPESVRFYAPEVTPATAYVIDRMLRKNPDERYKSYEELIEHLGYARTKLMGSIGQRGWRALLDKALEHAVGTIILLALLALGIFAYKNRETVFKKPEPIVARPEKTKEIKTLSPQALGKYERARKLMFEGKAQQALELLRPLEREEMSSKEACWLRFDEGLCALMNDDSKEAAAIFHKLSSGAAADDLDPALANFFAGASKLLDDEKTIPPEKANEYDTANQETIALLAFALKDWALEDFDSAKIFLQKFVIADPRGEFIWITDYKPIAERYLADYRAFEAVQKQLAGATTLEQKSAALAEAAKQKSALQTKGPMPEKFDGIIAELIRAGAKMAAAPMPEQNEPAAAAPSPADAAAMQKKQAEEKIWAAARAKYASLLAGYNFTDAENALASAAVSDADLVAQKNIAVRRADLLRIFKATLINDLNLLGYSGQIFKRTNIPLPQGRPRAGEAQISIVTQFGVFPSNWSEISPVSMIQMADYFSKRAVDANAAAGRWWLIGAFAIEFGMEREGRAYLERAAQVKPEYREQIQQLFPEPNAAPATPPTAPAP